ncbi:hypothetical protein LJB88_01875 [Erysipelotrichaceae bacterium OttesenSCG-928-M19]|nr:hypothetical protein [Erysipelotrichaceae bacterium OttesenSCG-928-M19]
METPLLMNTLNVTRDFILLDLYRKNIIFYFSPSSTFLSAIAASVIINLYLNHKIELNESEIKIVDESSIRTYNKLMIDYLKENEITDLREAAHEMFLDTDFSMQLYELVIQELLNENLIKVEETRQLILTKNIISLVDQNSVRQAYQKLFDTLFNDEQSQEFIALVLLIDTFFSIDDYFDESEHETIKIEMEKLRETPLYKDIAIFREVIEEFYQLIAQRSTNYFGV